MVKILKKRPMGWLSLMLDMLAIQEFWFSLFNITDDAHKKDDDTDHTEAGGEEDKMIYSEISWK